MIYPNIPSITIYEDGSSKKITFIIEWKLSYINSSQEWKVNMIENERQID